MISRRQFLRGQFTPRPSNKLQAINGPRIAAIGIECMAFAANVVCRSCGDACNEAAIRFSPRPGGADCPAILAERCTGCGDCVTVCPASAVKMTASGGKG